MEILFEWPTDFGAWLGFSIIWFFIILMVALAILFALYLFDVRNLTEKRGTGFVIGKKFTGSHYELIVINNVATNLSDLIPVNYPDVYKIQVQIDSSFDWVEVTESVYNQIRVLQTVPVNYAVSRMFKKLVIYSINL